MSSIEWTQETWNPITGCARVSPGCQHCYAEIMARRLKAMGQSQYQNVVNGKRWTGAVELAPDSLYKPYKRKKPTMYFVNSMSDLFHKDVTMEWLDEIWAVMSIAKQHTYQILTKRAELLPERVGAMVRTFGVLPNVWIGVSVETQEYADKRIPFLTATPAAVLFLSCEPLLGPLDLEYLAYEAAGPEWAGHNRLADWVIVGGESGPGARPMKAAWARDIRDQCQAANVPFFFKQWGGVNKKKAGRILDGRTWDEMPI